MLTLKKINQALNELQYLTYLSGRAATVVNIGAKALHYGGIPNLAKVMPYGGMFFGGVGVLGSIASIASEGALEKRYFLQSMV